jgi:hypothetical protein
MVERRTNAIRIRPIDPRSEAEEALVARRRRKTLVAVLGETSPATTTGCGSAWRWH